MPFRIRARAGGELEVEVDTPLEVQQLLQVALPGSSQAHPFLLALPPGPAVIDAAPEAAVIRRKYKPRRGGGRFDPVVPEYDVVWSGDRKNVSLTGR